MVEESDVVESVVLNPAQLLGDPDVLVLAITVAFVVHRCPHLLITTCSIVPRDD